MLQLQVLRQNPEWVKERLAVRNFKDTHLVDHIIQLDEQRKKLQLESDTTQSRINTASKEIGQLMAKGEKENAESKKQEVASLKSALQPIAAELGKAIAEANALVEDRPRRGEHQLADRAENRPDREIGE